MHCETFEFNVPFIIFVVEQRSDLIAALTYLTFPLYFEVECLNEPSSVSIDSWRSKNNVYPLKSQTPDKGCFSEVFFNFSRVTFADMSNLTQNLMS